MLPAAQMVLESPGLRLPGFITQGYVTQDGRQLGGRGECGRHLQKRRRLV